MSAPERGYVVYGATGWDSPWQAEQNFTHALAAHHPVLYVDPVVSPLTPFRYGVRPDTPRRVASVLHRGLRRRGRVTVMTPLVVPPIHHPRARRWSEPLVRRQVRAAVRRLGLQDPVVLAWRQLPALNGVAGESLRIAVVMDHPAAGASLMGRDPDELEAETHALCASADRILTTSHPTHELLAGRGWTSELVRFGFAADLAAGYDDAAEPEDYASLPRPLLGYTGGIDDRLDYELIVALADRFAGGSLVFVGPTSPRLTPAAQEALRARPNIHLLGPRPREALPAYVRHLDLALLPYADSLWTRHQSPMKLWEYLYAGPPILATGSAELRRYEPPLLHYAEDHAEALACAARALADPVDGRAARRAFALANTWDDRARQIAEVARRGPADRVLRSIPMPV